MTLARGVWNPYHSSGVPFGTGLVLDHFTHLLRFRTIVEAGSMRQASDRLGVTQPALTRSIGLLEDRFGKPLLRRHSRGVKPTEFGLRLLESVNRLSRQWEIAETDLAQPGVAVSGTIRMRAGTVWRAVVLPHLITELQKLYPNLSVEIDNGGTDSAMQDLAEGRCDVIFGGIQLGREPIAGLVWRQFTTVHDRVVARENHPIFDMAGADGKVDIARILDFPWIVYTAHPLYELETIHGAAERLGASPEIRVRTDSMVAALGLLQRGDYLSVLPAEGVAAPTNPRIVPIPIDHVNRAIQSGAIYREESADWPPLATLLELSEAAFAGWIAGPVSFGKTRKFGRPSD